MSTFKTVITTRGNMQKALRDLKRIHGAGKPTKRGDNHHKTSTEKRRRAAAAAKKRDQKNFSNKIKNVLAMSKRPVSISELNSIYK